MERICFIDLDGVLADFVTAACIIHGQPDLPNNWPRGEYSMETALGITRTQFWKGIQNSPQFWHELPAYPWVSRLVGIVREAQYRPVISTSPSKDPQCAAGKTAWIQKHLGDRWRDYFIGAKKDLLAADGRVLIDDSEENVDAFEHAGGIGLLFPQPWNRLHGMVDPLGYVRDALMDIG